MLKKILIIAALFFVIAVGITGYIVFIKDAPTPQNSDEGTSPFGTAGDAEIIPSDPNIQNQATNTRIPITQLMNLSIDPVIGAVGFTTANTPYVRYNLRANGHVLEINLLSGTSSKISNKTIPKLQHAQWLPNGKQTFIQYFNDTDTGITTYYSEFIPSTTTDPVQTIEQGGFFRPNISSFAISPDAKKIFSLVENQYGGFGIIGDIKDSTSDELFSYPVSEWLVSWPETSTLTITTKPSAFVGGYMYFVNAKTAARKKILSNISGLTTLTSPGAQYVLYSDASLNVKVATVSSNTITALPLRTIPEKCTWSQKEKGIVYCAVPTTVSPASYPDAWYQGKVGFTDEIYKINVVTGDYSIVAPLQSVHKRSIDSINLTLSSNEDYLIFSNKKDGTLWSFKLSR